MVNIWGRRDSGPPWEIEFLISEFDENEWVYRRNESIRGSIKNFGFIDDSGLHIIKPEIQLLYKSRSKRDKDVFDLKNCLIKMTHKEKDTLKNWISLDSGECHPWVEIINSNL